MKPKSSASGQAPRSSASIFEAASASARICLNIRLFQTLAIAPSKRIMLACRNEWKPITEPDRAFAHGRVFRAAEIFRRLSIKSCITLSRKRMMSSMKPGSPSHSWYFSIER